ncbi:hypothetical protein [Polyangium spumosum]|uniref:Uncharacterized protein n=1 Tax=Polyangium spumosum TaxID=889282 RepID=A0A6N7Q1P3_9BACT|nr:hypothetical protein [Polyangium spumosum]MRG98238.1 hypothetical protein [Polyangium spumosum]
MNSHTFEHHIRLALSPVSDEALRSEATGIEKYLTFSATCERRGVMIEPRTLDQAEQLLFDEGDLLPALAFYWLSVCAAIIQDSISRGTVAALLVPSARLILPLSVEDLCAEIGSNPWKSAAQLFVVWGADAMIFKRKSFPVRCAGAVFPIIDGVGMGWIADTLDMKRFSLFSRT